MPKKQKNKKYFGGTGKAHLRFFLPLLLCAALFLGQPASLVFGATPLQQMHFAGVLSSSLAGPATNKDESAPPPTESAQKEEDGILAPEGQGLYRPDYQPKAAAFCLLNVDTGLAVAQNNANTPLVAASLVKMMTCILAMEHMENFNKNLDTTLVNTADKSWVYDILYGKNASTADIRLGETLSVKELFYATLLPSANEGALFLADYISGGNMTNFMHMMNARAKSLGCTGTYFDDANGLSELNLTTAYDMALITMEFAKNQSLMEIAKSQTFEIAAHEKHNNPYTIHNTNRLLVPTSPYYKLYPGAAAAVLAGKTGNLGQWQNFASIASKNGETYVCVVLNSPYDADPLAKEMEEATTPRPALVESAALYNWAFENLQVRPALDLGQPVTEIKVLYAAKQHTVMLLPQKGIKAVLPKNQDNSLLKMQYNLPQAVTAPVKAGAVLGSISLFIGGQNIGTSPLMAEKDIARNQTAFILSKGKDALKSTYVKVLLWVCVLLLVLYAGFVWLASQSHKKNPKNGQKNQRGKP